MAEAMAIIPKTSGASRRVMIRLLASLMTCERPCARRIQLPARNARTFRDAVLDNAKAPSLHSRLTLSFTTVFALVSDAQPAACSIIVDEQPHSRRDESSIQRG